MCLPLSAPREAKEGSKTARLVGYKSEQSPRWATRGSVEQVSAHLDICARRAVPRNRSVSGGGDGSGGEGGGECALLCVYGSTTKSTAKISSGKNWMTKEMREGVRQQRRANSLFAKRQALDVLHRCHK